MSAHDGREPHDSQQAEVTAAPKVPPQEMPLRARPRPVKRLSRRMLALGTGVLAAAVLGATLWSLRASPRMHGSGIELHNVERVARADGLERLPRDYAGIPPAVASAPPVLGEPRPGDLGPAVGNVTPSGPSQGNVAGGDAAQAARLAAEEAARSPVFFQRAGAGQTPIARSAARAMPVEADASPTAGAPQPFDPRVAGASSPGLPRSGTGEQDPTRAQGQQAEKERFAGASPAQDTSLSRNTAPLLPPLSPYQVMAGAIIPAALATGINSDLPGQVIASVTQGVYDTASGQHLLIPQGSRLIGRYDSQVSFGQRRVLLIWTRLILPDASSIALDRLPGVDPAGYAGLEDGVDWHWDRILSAAALSTLLGVGAELAAPQDRFVQGDDRTVIALRDGVQSSINEVGQDLTRRSMSVQPTLTVRPGSAVSVMVNKDLVLRPYQPLFFTRTPP